MTSRHGVKLYIKKRLHSGLVKSDSHLGIIYDMNLIICLPRLPPPPRKGVTTYIAKGNSLPCEGFIDNFFFNFINTY